MLGCLVFLFSGHAVWVLGSQFPDQGLNLAPAVKPPDPNHQTTTELIVLYSTELKSL